MNHPDPAIQEQLPLKPLEFSILLVLAQEESYGYGIVQRIAERRIGGVRMAPGNLYQVLDRMIDAGFIQEADRRNRPDGDARRRYYAITPFGRRVAEAEAVRLQAVMGTAEALDLVPSGGEG